ncbi:MAG: diacylglycerol kinase family lipid kinase, partial [Lachnospiraceae bacterium]|nr:diacylglycerol kinase family lipid kinase [Lachnospiraceae bacterium]
MIHFIVNAHARSGEAHNIWNNLEQILISKAIEYTVYYTEYPGHAIELANNISSLACEENPITLVIFGGDGSVNEVYNGITSNHKYITLGYIPTGSGNDYARGLSLPRNSEEALNLILSSTSTKLVEHGIVHNDGNTRKFAVSCGIGYDADVTYRVANSSLKKKFNKLKI